MYNNGRLYYNLLRLVVVGVGVVLLAGQLIVGLAQLRIGGDTLHQCPAGTPDDHILKHK